LIRNEVLSGLIKRVPSAVSSIIFAGVIMFPSVMAENFACRTACDHAWRHVQFSRSAGHLPASHLRYPWMTLQTAHKDGYGIPEGALFLSVKRCYPANLCRLLGLPEFFGF
jgi:hypothetical protein